MQRQMIVTHSHSFKALELGASSFTDIYFASATTENESTYCVRKIVVEGCREQQVVDHDVKRASPQKQDISEHQLYRLNPKR